MKSVSPAVSALILQNEHPVAPPAAATTTPAIVASSTAGSISAGSALLGSASAGSATASKTAVSINPGIGNATLISKGSIWLDSSGTLYVQGTDATNDTVTISIDNKGTASTADDMVRVVLSNAGLPLIYEFPVAKVTQLNVQTFGGDDYVDNQTSIPMFADGGPGNDVLLGGTGNDILFGGSGAGNDYLDGRAGNDILIAGAGTDMLFGDDGNDSLYGCAGAEAYLFGGNGNDQLYGEGSGYMFGGAGTNTLIDYTGQNVRYQDYGPNEGVIDQPQNFDWFDRNLTDPALRSLVRLEYRDMLFDRTDALNLFNEVAADGTVSANEFADLQKLGGTILQEPESVNYLFDRVVDGDAANATYLGAKLGNLKAGSSSTQLNDLVDKWFYGTDLPSIGNTSGTPVSYMQVNGTLFGANGPVYTDVDQGNLADCYLLSSLGEVAIHSPQTIENMFINNGDGTYTVCLHDDLQEAFVTVNGQLPVAQNDYAYFAGWGFSDVGKNGYYLSSNVLWVALAEKAYAQVDQSGWIGENGTNTYAGISMGEPSYAYNVITGQTTTDEIIVRPGPALITELAQDLSFNMGITISTYADASKVAAGLVVQHTYMITGVNLAAGTIQLFNPHNATDSVNETLAPVLDWQQIGASFQYFTIGSA